MATFACWRKEREGSSEGRVQRPDGTVAISSSRSQGTTKYRVLSPRTLQGNSTSFVLEVDAGATVERPLTDAPYGRGGCVVESFGDCWSIMTSNAAYKP